MHSLTKYEWISTVLSCWVKSLSVYSWGSRVILTDDVSPTSPPCETRYIIENTQDKYYVYVLSFMVSTRRARFKSTITGHPLHSSRADPDPRGLVFTMYTPPPPHTHTIHSQNFAVLKSCFRYLDKFQANIFGYSSKDVKPRAFEMKSLQSSPHRSAVRPLSDTSQAGRGCL